MREATIADLRVLPPGLEVAVALSVPEAPEGELFALDAQARFGVFTGDAGVLVGPCADASEVVTALGDRPVVMHDAKAMGPVPANLAHDTLLGAYLLEPARRGYPFAELCDERGLATGIEDAAAAAALLTGALAGWQREQLVERGLQELMDEVELPLVTVLAGMEAAGMRLDKPRLALIKARVDEEIASLERQVWELAGEEFVIGSPQQLGHVLFEKLGLSRKRRGKTGFSTDARVLQAIRDEHPIIPKIERWRELNQLSKTYLDVLPHLTDDADRIHTTFLQAVAQTGRLSSTNPNMQNVPVRTELGREIRGCFRAADGHVLVSADYSQVELRILAHVAGEQVLKDIFLRGEDVHTATASTGLRQAGRGAHADGPLQGQDDQLRHRLRPQRLRPGRSPEHPARGGQAVHRHIPRTVLRRSRSSCRTRSSRPRSRATSRRSTGAAARSPSCGPATSRCAHSASAWQ